MDGTGWASFSTLRQERGRGQGWDGHYLYWWRGRGEGWEGGHDVKENVKENFGQWIVGVSPVEHTHIHIRILFEWHWQYNKHNVHYTHITSLTGRACVGSRWRPWPSRPWWSCAPWPTARHENRDKTEDVWSWAIRKGYVIIETNRMRHRTKEDKFSISKWWSDHLAIINMDHTVAHFAYVCIYIECVKVPVGGRRRVYGRTAAARHGGTSAAAPTPWSKTGHIQTHVRLDV